MTKREAIAYLTKELTKVAAELAPAEYLGNVTTKYSGNGTKISMAFGTDKLSLFVGAEVYGDSANVRHSGQVKRRDSQDVLSERTDTVYFYKDDHSKTDMKRWCIERFEKIAEEFITIFLAEYAKLVNIGVEK